MVQSSKCLKLLFLKPTSKLLISIFIPIYLKANMKLPEAELYFYYLIATTTLVPLLIQFLPVGNMMRARCQPAHPGICNTSEEPQHYESRNLYRTERAVPFTSWEKETFASLVAMFFLWMRKEKDPEYLPHNVSRWILLAFRWEQIAQHKGNKWLHMIPRGRWEAPLDFQALEWLHGAQFHYSLTCKHFLLWR